MLHCKNSRPDIFQAFPLFIKNEVKVSINLERTIWHTMGNQSWTHASRWVQTHADCRSFSGNLSSLRPLHPFNDSIVPSFCCSERFTPLASNEPVRRVQLLLRYSVYFSIWCLLPPMHRHLREEALQLHVSYHCTFCNKFNSVQIWPWGTKTLNTKCAL